MLLSYTTVAAVAFLAGALFEGFSLLREQKKHGFVSLHGGFYTLNQFETPTEQLKRESQIRRFETDKKMLDTIAKINTDRIAKEKVSNDLRCFACGIKHEFDDLRPAAEGKQLYMTLVQCKGCGGKIFTKLEVVQ